MSPSSARVLVGGWLLLLAEFPAFGGADLHGDPLPPAAVARLGWVRLRHADTACTVAFTPDGKTLVSGGADRVIRVWDAVTGKEKGRLTGHKEEVRSLAVAVDGRT